MKLLLTVIIVLFLVSVNSIKYYPFTGSTYISKQAPHTNYGTDESLLLSKKCGEESRVLISIDALISEPKCFSQGTPTTPKKNFIVTCANVKLYIKEVSNCEEEKGCVITIHKIPRFSESVVTWNVLDEDKCSGWKGGKYYASEPIRTIFVKEGFRGWFAFDTEAAVPLDKAAYMFRLQGGGRVVIASTRDQDHAPECEGAVIASFLSE